MLARLRSGRPGRMTVPVLVAGGLLLSVTVAGATGAELQPGEAVYRCRSATGQMFVGQSIAAECIGQDVDVLDASGRNINGGVDG